MNDPRGRKRLDDLERAPDRPFGFDLQMRHIVRCEYRTGFLALLLLCVARQAKSDIGVI